MPKPVGNSHFLIVRCSLGYFSISIIQSFYGEKKFRRLAVASSTSFSVQSKIPLDIIMRFLSILLLAELGVGWKLLKSFNTRLNSFRNTRRGSPTESPVEVADLNEEVIIPRADDPRLHLINLNVRKLAPADNDNSYETTDEQTRH